MRHLVLILAVLSLGLVSCDPDRKKKCEWFLMPDVDRIGKVDQGYIPVCTRNFESNKQDCRLQATLEFAKKHYNKKFKYSEMDYDGPGIPRTITKISHCE